MALSSVMDLKVVVANRIFLALLPMLVVPEELYVPVPGDGVQVEVPGADGVQGAAFTPHLRLFHSFYVKSNLNLFTSQFRRNTTLNN